MLLNQTIPSAPETDPGLDQQQLFAIGMDHIRRLSGKLWSDHNIHDPGITILELASYAQTELAYRAQFPIEDLLAAESDNAGRMRDQFHPAEQILPNRALTINDYRKLLIDMPGIRNAWLFPAQEILYADTINRTVQLDDPRLTTPGQKGIREIPLKGLYKVLLEIDSNATSTVETLKREAMALLQENRNLCEDFIEVDIVQDQYYSLCAELELDSSADQNKIAARIQFGVEQYLAPAVMSYTLDEMLARRRSDQSEYAVADIFEGPLLRHGFIDEDELAQGDLRSEIHLSDIINLIMSVEGVLAVRDITVNPLYPGNDPDDRPVSPPSKWVMPVPSGKRPRLSETHGRLVCYKRGYPVPLDPAKGAMEVTNLENALSRKLDTPIQANVAIPAGNFRDVTRYHSFQHHFPVIYGLSDQGLPSGADDLRKAQALQLKAYLLFFDQVMANYLAQLGNAWRLFSMSPQDRRSYFAQMVSDFVDSTRIYGNIASNTQLESLLEDETAAEVRLDRFMDHLLARVAEDFQHYVAIMHAAFGTRAEDSIEIKREFFRNYPQLGAERSLAFNQALKNDFWNTPNISGLERRIAALLGIINPIRRNLSTAPHDIYPEVDKTPGDEFRFRIKHRATNKILLSSSAHYATAQAAETEMASAIRQARYRNNYQIKTTHDQKYYFNIVNEQQNVIARQIRYFAKMEQLNAAIDEVMLAMKTYQLDDGEGMYVIENILLRPQEHDDPSFNFCPVAGSSTSPDDDHYSYRLHFILPSYAGRFADTNFRRFVEETIRMETPAHILPKICWVNSDDMAEIEAAYHDWLQVNVQTEPATRNARLDRLIRALTRSKNVYYSQALHECSDQTGKEPFLLGKTALGSQSQD